jgi:hypothetical protein
MPWLSEEVAGWDEMSDDEKELFRAAARELWITVDRDEDDDDYYE